MANTTQAAASLMNKRALIVDDSRSARVILGRMLEGYGLDVDSAESAEQALEYLKQTRPDVIFMDHLMPGMDGFQAVQVIKSNPETSTIPVVMYTSQEGELYASQARALGAVGVLPKTVKQVDVSRMLYQLRLLSERREPRDGRVSDTNAERSAESFNQVTIETQTATVGEIEQAIRAAMSSPLKEQSAELRRFVLASLEAFARRIGTELKQSAPESEPPEQAPVAAPPEPPVQTPSRWPLVALIVAVAVLPTAILALLYTRTLESAQDLMRSNARLATIVEEQHAQIVNLQQRPEPLAPPGSAAQSANSVKTQTELVPYGEVPLSGARSDKLRELIGRLKADNFQGQLRIATFTGNFCLTGNGIEGYSLAADDLPAKRCDQIGNPFDDTLSTPQRQSLAFANLLASTRRDKDAAFTIEVTHEGHQPSFAEPDPEVSSRMTARELNRIAAQNNRVEFSLEPVR
jgi:CheY-like chemotaxis protein